MVIGITHRQKQSPRGTLQKGAPEISQEQQETPVPESLF